MPKAYQVALLAALAAALVIAGSCGSAPVGNVAGSGTTQTEPPPYRYTSAVNTDQDAVQAVLAMLNSEAKTNDARLYLAEYLMVAGDRVSDINADQQTWYVTFGMDRKADPGEGEKSYWESAAWIVFKDGTVMPSDRHAGNAARILTDLRARSS